MIKHFQRILLSDSKIALVLISSLFLLIFSIYLGEYHPNYPINWDIISLILGSIASSVFFPLLIGIYIEYIKELQGGGFIWSIFEEYFEGGILRVYKDREKIPSRDNAVTDLINSFIAHKNGTIKLVGVSLRVFFNQTSDFYNNIQQLSEMHLYNNNLKMRALVCSINSPEVLNRAKIESPDDKDPLIRIEINQTMKYIKELNSKYNEPIEYGFYDSAPYCTLVIFPDKCYFSPNILSNKKPVRLPMIVFARGSSGYERLNEYADYLWENKII